MSFGSQGKHLTEIHGLKGMESQKISSLHVREGVNGWMVAGDWRKRSYRALKDQSQGSGCFEEPIY
jgi:hypothetical protein